MKSNALAKQKPDPPSDELADDPAVSQLSPQFQEAYERWRAVRQNFRELTQRYEALKTGLGFLRFDPPQPRVKPLIAAFDQELLARIRRSPRRAELELEELTDRIVDGQDAYHAASRTFQEAKAEEADRIARLFVDRHLEAIRKLASAIERLSLAVADERAVRADFAKASPEPTSALLQDWSLDFSGLDLTKWDSRASVWARRLRQSGLVQ